jgi:hypothetical protein
MKYEFHLNIMYIKFSFLTKLNILFLNYKNQLKNMCVVRMRFCVL